MMDVESLVEDSPRVEALPEYDRRSSEENSRPYEGLSRIKETVFNGGTSIMYWM